MTTPENADSKTCLNCHSPVGQRYCPNCGQKTSTHRYSLKHFLTHGLIHGLIHLDSGILYTAKELCTRPGHSVREYIQGKRARHFNYLTLLMVLATLGYLLSELTTVTLSALITVEGQSTDYLGTLEKVSVEYPKTYILLTIPLYALTSFLWFMKAKQNFTEHLVINSYKAAAELMLWLLFWILTLFYTDKSGLLAAYTVLSIAVTVYSIWFYYQYFSVFGYSKAGLLVRSLMASITISLVSGIITAIAMIVNG